MARSSLQGNPWQPVRAGLLALAILAVPSAPPSLAWAQSPPLGAAEAGEAAPAAQAERSEPAAQEAQPASRIPPPRTTYMGRTIAATMHYTGAPWLIRESREREEDCTTMLEQLRLKPGMTACDMGCGNGFYALKMSETIGETGRVLAVDIQQEMLRLLEQRAKEQGVTNIEPVLGTLVDPKLPRGQVDLILCVDVYHEFSHPEEMLAAMRAALKPDGQLVLVEFRLEDPDVPIKTLHKMSKAQIMKELPPNGYRLVREFDELPWQHMMFFERDD